MGVRPLRRSRSEITAAVAESLRQMSETATNIQSVVNRTDIAEQEVVSEFGSMHGLILALVSQQIDALSLPLQDDPPQGKKEYMQRLLQFGQGVAEAYSFYVRRLYRIAITESIRNSGFGREFYEVGPNRLTRRLASFLEQAQQAGAISLIDSRSAAELFLSLMRASLDLIDNSSNSCPAKEGQAHIAAKQAIDLFHDGILGQKE